MCFVFLLNELTKNFEIQVAAMVNLVILRKDKPFVSENPSTYTVQPSEIIHLLVCAMNVTRSEYVFVQELPILSFFLAFCVMLLTPSITSRMADAISHVRNRY